MPAQINSHTFVVHIQPEGPSTLENISTHERIKVNDLSAVGAQIDLWLQALKAPAGRGADRPASSAS